MVFLPDTPHNIFKDAMGKWGAWRDGAPIEPTPATYNTDDAYAFKIPSDFKSRDGHNIEYKKGMQGVCLSEADLKGRRMAKIFIQGVTQHGPGPGQRNAWVPVELIKRGLLWSHDITDWNVDVAALPQTFRLSTIPQTGHNKLAHTVTALLKAFQDTPMPFMTEFIKFVSMHGITAVSNAIVKGFQDAGMDSILAQDDCTSIQMYQNARCHIDDTNGNDTMGVYVRVSKSLSGIKKWKPNTRYAYVGKTETTFTKRFVSHPNSRSTYGILSRMSEGLKSFALCILPDDSPSKLFFIAEQISICLIGSYRADVIDGVRGAHARMIADVASASYFIKISAQVFSSTAFVPVLTRPSFGIREGANCRSPLEEMGSPSEKMLYLRTDYNHPDYRTKTPIPMAEFRRHVPRVQPRGDEGGQCKLFQIAAQDPFDMVQTVYLKTPKGKADDIEYPAKGTPFQVVVEVRLDGRCHEQSWARLPFVSIFKNSEQANSFAIRIEWQESRGSKRWRFRYICYDKGLWLMEDENVSGSLRRYSRAIGMLHWFFNVDPVYTEAWIPKPVSRMRVLQVSYDYMTRTIHFLPPTAQYNMLPFTRNSARNIQRQMYSRNLYERSEEKGKKGRYACDLCFIRRFSVTEHQCTGEGRACKLCRSHGLPFCPWTPGLKTGIYYYNTPAATTEEKNLVQSIRAALFDISGYSPNTSGIIFEQVFYPLVAGDEDENKEDDEDENEEDDEDENEEDDEDENEEDDDEDENEEDDEDDEEEE